MQLPGKTIPDERIAGLCRQYGIRRMWLFGSVLRPDFRADSDVDVLIELAPGTPMGLFALGGLQMDMTDLFGREAHVTTLGSVPDPVRSDLLRSAQLQYAA
jgi:predicted nucleotidyltransferase